MRTKMPSYKQQQDELRERIRNLKQEVACMNNMIKMHEEELAWVNEKIANGMIASKHCSAKVLTLKEQVLQGSLLEYINKVDISEENKKVILEYITSDLSQAEIARKFGISTNTVHYIMNTFVKMANEAKNQA